MWHCLMLHMHDPLNPALHYRTHVMLTVTIFVYSYSYIRIQFHFIQTRNTSVSHEGHYRIIILFKSLSVLNDFTPDALGTELLMQIEI